MAKILIVDDSPTEMHILKSAVEEAGHDVVTAENGEESPQQPKGADQAKMVLRRLQTTNPMQSLWMSSCPE